jgi:hypothetical protein
MVGLVIAVPQMVMVYKGGEGKVNPSTIDIELPSSGTPPTEQQEQKREDEQAQSLEKAFGGSTGAPPADKQNEEKQKQEDDAAKSLENAFRTPAEPPKK